LACGPYAGEGIEVFLEIVRVILESAFGRDRPAFRDGGVELPELIGIHLNLGELPVEAQAQILDRTTPVVPLKWPMQVCQT